MRRPDSATGRRLADERGFTLPELLVATIIALLVAAGAMIVLQTAVRTQPEVSERAAQIQEGRTMIERISRELRQGDSVTGATTTSLSIHTLVDSASCGGAPAQTAIPCWVTYACSGGTCSRTEHDGSGGGSASEVVSGLRSSNVFCYALQSDATCPAPTAADPEYVGVTMSFPNQDGGESITLSDGVALRNHTPPPE